MLRTTKIMLMTSVTVFLFLGAFFNFYDWAGTTGAVAATTSMATNVGAEPDWRATTSPIVVWTGALFIPLFKAAAGVLCAIGVWRMWGARKGDAAAFAKAKEYALAGCGIAMFLLFAGWIVIAETWFELWRSDALRDAALQTAFRYGAMVTLIALFVATRDE